MTDPTVRRSPEIWAYGGTVGRSQSTTVHADDKITGISKNVMPVFELQNEKSVLKKRLTQTLWQGAIPGTVPLTGDGAGTQQVVARVTAI